MVSRPTTNEAFIRRLTEITESNLKNEHFGVSELAKQMGISRSNLYLKVHTSTKKSVSCFIREIRLRKAFGHLKEGELNVSETAYEVGYNSPAYFIKCFHDYYGFPPGETPSRNQQSQITPASSKLCSSITGVHKILIGSIIFVALILVGLLIYSPKSFQSSTEKSVAVLPFKNLSADTENQYFADGMMEEIVQNLSQIRDIKVISVTSTYKYRNTNESLPQIGKELKVAYILEGSVLKENERVKIAILFNDAKKNKVIWSENFNYDFKDIFDLQSNISQQITEKLAAIITPEEKERIHRRYTFNTEAYTLYLKGIFFWKRRTFKDLERSIDYYNQALTIDPNYALAYAGLADSYLSLTFDRYLIKEKGFLLGKEYATKALSINPDLAEAHAVLGSIATWYLRDWQLAEEELQKTIELKPNYAVGHQYYSELLALQGKLKEAISEVNKAIELDPNSAAMYLLKANRYYHLKQFDKTLINAQRSIEIRPDYISAHWVIFRTYLHIHDDENALRKLKTIFRLSDPDLNFNRAIADSYLTGGMKNVVFWTINQINTNPKMTSFSPYYKYKLIAELYAVTGENDLAIDYLEKHAESELFKPAWIKHGIEFQALKTNPRFIAIINKMGLSKL